MNPQPPVTRMRCTRPSLVEWVLAARRLDFDHPDQRLSEPDAEEPDANGVNGAKRGHKSLCDADVGRADPPLVDDSARDEPRQQPGGVERAGRYAAAWDGSGREASEGGMVVAPLMFERRVKRSEREPVGRNEGDDPAWPAIA